MLIPGREETRLAICSELPGGRRTFVFSGQALDAFGAKAPNSPIRCRRFEGARRYPVGPAGRSVRGDGADESPRVLELLVILISGACRQSAFSRGTFGVVSSFLPAVFI